MDGEMPAGGGRICDTGATPDPQKNVTPDWLVGLLLSVLVIGVYGQTLHFEFLSWDDFRHVCNNPAVREGLTLESVAAAFTSRLTFHWHPLTMLSHMLDVELFGLHAGGHHATNVLLHLLNTILLFSLFHSMSGSRWPSALVAAIFAVHPLHVENVAWIWERKDLLCAFFGLLSIHAYLRYVRQRRGAWFALACVMLLFGLLSKSMLIILPLVLLLLDYWPLSRFDLPRPGIAGGDRSSRRHLSPTTIIGSVVEKLPLFAISMVFAGVSFLVHRVAAQNSHLSAVPLPQRLSNAAVSYAWYVAKTFWPTKLAAN